MGELINPYIAGAPVTEARMFFGREEVFQWIENSIAGQYADHILVIHGQRRVGKTSVLKQLGNRLPKRFIPVFFDLQGRTHTTLDRFLWWLAREIVRVLKQERGIEVPLPEKDAFAADIEYFEHRFLPDLKPAIGNDTLLLTFDEFDNLEESEVKEELARPLTDYLRRLMGNGGLNFIFSIGSSGRKLENMQAAYTEFFKTALYKKISFLNEDQTRNLITRPIENILEYDRRAVTRIYQLAGGHPYFTQLTCHELFAKCQQSDERIIKETDVESVLDDVVERGTVNLKFVWDEASDIEKWSLSALAQLERSDNRSVADYLRKHRVRFSDTDLTSGLLHLREKDILTVENRFVIHLLRLWLRKNRPIEQALEELTEVNPIANRYIEIGLEFKDSHLYEKAIESFQEALAVAKDNVQAQVNIGLVYMDMKAYDKAVIEFEKALTMDDEDVAARSGLCEAHLSLGDSALAKGRIKDAIVSYQRVLAINTEHTEARGRMAEIARQRAEQALAGGRDEEALSAFGDALKFTPEDPALTARVDQVRAEKKAKVLAALITRSEKEAGAKNWQGAIKSLEEALPLAPDDPSIQKKISEIKVAQEKERLDALLAKADAAAKSARWDEAIEALNAILAAKPNEEAESRLTEVRAKQRDAKLSELKMQARGLARSEQFDKALSLWDQYLALEPSDRETALAEIGQVKNAQALAKSYADAQKVFAKKHYDQAVNLLKEIVNQDENYRDASYLLSQAIELRRTARKWWQSRWVWGGVGVVVLAAVAWSVFRYGLPLLDALPSSTLTPTGIGETGVPSTLTPTGIGETGVPSTLMPGMATFTPSPTVTPTPLPLKWTRLNSGQFSQPAAAEQMFVDPSDPGVIYVTALFSTYRTIDGGISWQPVQYNGVPGRFSPIFIDPANSQIMYIEAGWGGGIYRTMDGGRNWQEWETAGGGSPHFDPRNSNHMYSFNPWDRKLYESVDGGKSWQLNFAGDESCLQQDQASVLKIKYPSTNDMPLMIASNTGGDCGLYQSLDNGHTWTLIGLKGDNTLAGLELGEDKDGNVVIYIHTNSDGFIVSYDNGDTWNHPAYIDCSLEDVQITVDERTPTRAYCVNKANNDTLWATEDSGRTWKELSPSQDFGAVSNIFIHYLDKDQYIYIGSDKGFFISKDQGKTWTRRSNGLGAATIQLAIDPVDPSILYADSQQTFSTQTCNLYRSNDGGRNWNLILSGQNGSSCQPKFDSKNTIYVVNNSKLQRSYDRGNTWNELGTEYYENNGGGISWVAVNSNSTDQIVAGTRYPQIQFSSSDSGFTWHMGNGITSPRWLGFEIRAFFDNIENRIYAISFQDVFYSEDGGLNWTACAFPSGAVMFDGIFAMDPTNPHRMFLATIGGKYFAKGGLYISNDACQSWQPTSLGEIDSFVNTIAIDPNHPDTLYAGANSGAYISYDSGQSWNQVNEGLLGATMVYSIVVDKDSNVYAATPYGIFKLEGR